jgi:hypothetical protein
MEFFIGDSLCNWHDEQCSQFANGFYRWNSVSNFVSKIIVITHFWVTPKFFFFFQITFLFLKKKNSAVLNGTVPLLLCPCRGREEDFKSFLAQFITLPLALLTQPIPSLMKKQETHAPHHDKKKAMPCSGCTGPIPRHHALHLNRYGDPLPRHSINIREDYRTKGGRFEGQKER